MDNINSESAVFSAMQTEKPYKSYRKTILGQVYVKILNPFNTNEPQGLILSGEDNTADAATVQVWSPKEDQFLRTMNKKHFERGYLVLHSEPEVRKISEEEKFNTLNDEEIEKLVNSRWFKLQAGLNKMTSEAPIYRSLKIAEELDKSEKVVNLIKGRLSEVQALPEPPQQVS